ncbi:unnamed protein product [Acanthoscelides obtectus]|uniref:Uncharacterized protein n=1 Tax=Acanthoscelides obtectus TaxID=200917 RepID=A0A9P0KRE9_ACAOB|nr:unnamed protein product [Acanthoscelides obtectus]CAK1675842.1 hypothetical protein AOBTE_LOCUS30442 [Acanthoscelides obtectus]
MLKQVSCCLVVQAALIWCCSLAALDDLPPDFPRCRRNDPQIEKCLMDASETLRPYLRTGVPGLLPAVQNYTIRNMVMKDGNDALNYRMEIPEVVFYGMDNYEMKKISFDPKSLTFYMEYVFQELEMKGNYNLQGRIFFAPLNGRGSFRVHLSGTRVSLLLNMKVVKKNGVEYLKTIRSVPQVDTGEIKDYDFEGLFAENGSNNNEVGKSVQ